MFNNHLILIGSLSVLAFLLVTACTSPIEEYCADTGLGRFVFSVQEKLPNGEFYRIKIVAPTGDTEMVSGMIKPQKNSEGVEEIYVMTLTRAYGPLKKCKQ